MCARALTLLPVIICILTLSKGAVAVLLMAPVWETLFHAASWSCMVIGFSCDASGNARRSYTANLPTTVNMVCPHLQVRLQEIASHLLASPSYAGEHSF